MKHKKSIFDYYSIRITPCAPEMTKIYYNGELCSANNELLSDIWYKAITKGLPDGFAVLKNAVRKQQNKQRFFSPITQLMGDVEASTNNSKGVMNDDVRNTINHK